MLTPDPLGIPALLKAIPQWVLWKVEERGGKPTKVPYALPGSRASVDNPQTWAAFEAVVERYNQGGFAGIGLVLTSELGLVGLDLDGAVRQGEGDLEGWAAGIVESLNTYTEYSPSGKGLRLFATGELPGSGRRRGPVEVYSAGRYLTLTGRPFGEVRPIAERTAALKELWERLEGHPDQEVLKRAGASRVGPAFLALYEGSWDGYPSQSEADLALCNYLAFFCKGDRVQMERLFRQSGLYRPKWEERHSGNGATYGQMTLQKALQARTVASTPTAAERLRQGLGLEVIQVHKYLTEPPRYGLKLPDKEVDVGGIEGVVRQERFRLQVAQGLNRMVPLMGKNEWERMAEALTELVVEVEVAGADGSGMIKSWLRRYLELHPPAASDTPGYEWAFTHLQPLLVSGKPLVSAEGLHRWIRLTEPLERRELTLALKRSGAESRELFRRIQGRGLKRWYWAVGHLMEWEDTQPEG